MRDAIVIGGGFYGAAISIYLKQKRGLERVLLVERTSQLLSRASYNNQARVHNGYHYPRSFTTAYRSRVNLPRFLKDWPDVVKTDFTKIYAIAVRNSKVTARQFERFCRGIGASIRPTDAATRSLFNPRLIEDVFLVEEYAFDSSRLAAWAQQQIRDTGVELRYETQASDISASSDGRLRVGLRGPDGARWEEESRLVFNCTYSGLNQYGGDFPGTRVGLKQEITEMGLIEVPPALRDIGVTVMDGPFFSIMPFPARGLHTISHVRYTPHLSWEDRKGMDPYLKLDSYDRSSRVDRMIRDVSRYMPSVMNAQYRDSLFEVKTVLVKNESDDGRPILFEQHSQLPGCFSVLGGKIDNIYDVLEKLDAEPLTGGREIV